MNDYEQQMAAQRKKFVKLGLWAVILLFTVFCFFKSVVTVGAQEIVVVQYPNGTLEVYNTPGIHPQWFGSVTRYKKSFQYWFSKGKDQGGEDESIKVRFNDGGHAQLSGSCRIDMPSDIPSLTSLHIRYGSQEAIEKALVRTNIEKAVYMTGPLMSSKESSNQRRTDLLNFISDQAEYGVYKTKQTEKRLKEEGSDSSKVVTIVVILQDSITGRPLRQTASPFADYHLVFNNLSINSLDYDSTIEKQIRAQQELTMQVQTAMAAAKTAEQQLYTTQKQGEANAAAAKWEQEKIKATEVTKAEQELAVQKLNTEKAAAYKQEQILQGEGEAEKKRLLMNANGALDVKLQAYVAVMSEAWKAIGAYTGNWVPTYQSGSGGTQNGAFNMMEILSAKMLRDLNIDLSTKK